MYLCRGSIGGRIWTRCTCTEGVRLIGIGPLYNTTFRALKYAGSSCKPAVYIWTAGGRSRVLWNDVGEFALAVGGDRVMRDKTSAVIEWGAWVGDCIPL